MRIRQILGSSTTSASNLATAPGSTQKQARVQAASTLVGFEQETAEPKGIKSQAQVVGVEMHERKKERLSFCFATGAECLMTQVNTGGRLLQG